MVRQSLLYPLMLLSISVSMLTTPDALAQQLSVSTLHTRLDAIRKKTNPEQIILLNELTQEWQRSNGTDSSYALIMQHLGKVLIMAGQYEAAEKKTQAGIVANRQHIPGANPAGQIESYLLLGDIKRALRDNVRSIAYYETCVRLGKFYKTNYESVGAALIALSFLHQEKGDYQRALNSAEDGVYYAHHCRNKSLEAKCLTEEARDLMWMGNPKEALPLIDQAIQLIQGDLTAADSRIFFTNIKAQIAWSSGHSTLSVALYKQVIAYYKHTQQEEQLAYAYGNLGYLYMDSFKDYKKALTNFQLAYKAFSNPYEKARALNNIGTVYWHQKQYEKALATYQLAFQILPINFHKADIHQNPPVDAMRLSAEKEYLLTLIQDKAGTWLEYAQATKNRSYFRAALDTYKVADQMVDVMRWEHTGEQSKLFWRGKTRGLYERAIETCYQLNDTEQAFRFMEKSRAVMLADKLNELGANQQLTQKQRDQEQHLLQRVGSLQHELAGLAPDNARYGAVRMNLMASEDSLRGVLKALEASNPAYYRYKYDNATPSLTEVRHYLKTEQSALVTYFVGDSALYVMAVMGKKTLLRKQRVELYNQTINQFNRLLTSAEAMRKTTDVSRFLMLSNQLYAQLLAPLSLPAGRVIVSPDGFFIPFDALSRSATGPDYAVNDYAFSYVYSVRLLLKDRVKQRTLPGLRTRDFLGVAPVDFAPSLNQVMLPNSDEALKPIANRFSSSTMLTHDAATRRAFLTQAAQARIIHLFTHAVADTTDAEPKLYFADSTLQLSDLRDDALPNAELVVLAACKTGIGANQRGEGVFSLARGFAALGVPSVLTTLWSVQTDATYQLTDRFYGYLDQGIPKDVALQRAKLDWLKTADGLSQLPNYWAGLIIVGDAAPLSQPHLGWWLAGLVLLVAGGLSIWWFRAKRQVPSTLPVADLHPV